MVEGMTARQVALARHALGLPNSSKQSFRNRYVAGYGTTRHDDFDAMVQGGFAERAKVQGPSGLWRFWLTKKGAKAVLLSGERLCREDFPR